MMLVHTFNLNFCYKFINFFFRLGLNVGLQSLATNISGIQNVQVSIPGFAVPISLSLNVPGATAQCVSSSAIIVTSPSTMNVRSTFFEMKFEFHLFYAIVY